MNPVPHGFWEKKNKPMKAAQSKATLSYQELRQPEWSARNDGASLSYFSEVLRLKARPLTIIESK